MHIYNTPNNITAFSTMRDGGVSFPANCKLYLPHHQVHGTTTRIIDTEFINKNALEQTLLLDCVDAMSTDIPNVCVCVKTADCIPVLLWDEKKHVVSAVHAGWKGTRLRIVEENIDVLKTIYGVNTTDLHAIIGPGIGPDSFEIGDEVYDDFAKHGFNMNKLAKLYPNTKPTHEKPMKWHINLWECNRLQLIEKGINPDNIHVCGIDTFQNFDHFHSARRNTPGRIINGIYYSL